MDYLAAMRAFSRSAELGNFSRAAEESGIKVSTISRYVTFLEQDLGAALFNRSTRRLHLTEMGRIFLERANAILDDVGQIRTLVSTLNASPQGLLRVQLPKTFGQLHVTNLLGDFLSLHPMINVEATFIDGERDIIEAGADVAIRIGSLADSRLMARKIASHRYILCVSAEYSDCRGAPTTPDDLVSRDCLVLTQQSATVWSYACKSSEGYGEIKVSGRMRSNDIDALRVGALCSQGYALLPGWLAASDIGAGKLKEVLPGYCFSLTGEMNEGIWIVYPPKKVVPSKVRTFIEFLEERYRSVSNW